MKKVFVCTDHEGYWPVGTASVIIAQDEHHARELLAKELRARSLNDNVFTVKELESKCGAHILCDGNY